MSDDDFVFSMAKPSAKKKFTYKKLRESATMMSGALPSPPADQTQSASTSSTRKNASRACRSPNGTPPSAQRPQPSQDSPAAATPPKAADPVAATDSGMMPPDDVDDDALLAPTQPTKPAATQERNAFTVLASSQARQAKTTPAARPKTTKWTTDEEWIVVEGIRQGLAQAQILFNLLPSDRSASAIRGKKRELQERFGDKMEKLANKDALSPRPAIPAPPMPPRMSWTPSDTDKLREAMSKDLTERQIAAMYFPRRTEDSVLGKIRKLRAADGDMNESNKKARRVRADKLFSSRSKYASSSPALGHSSSQTVQRSSPAQAAFKRKSEITTNLLPVLQEEEMIAKDQAEDAEAGAEHAEVDVEEAGVEDVDGDVVENVGANFDEDVNEDVNEDADEDFGDVDDNDFEDLSPEADDAEDVDYQPHDTEVQPIDAKDANANTADADNVENDTVGEGVIPNSPIPSKEASPRTAYVVLPERPDLNDVIDLRDQPVVHINSSMSDREAQYAATTPPFPSGQEREKVGMFHSTKISVWREAYARCKGDADKAYRMYEELVTTEHMLQAVCNLEYEIINGIKAVRMRRARELALLQGKEMPKFPVQDQPKHLDLFGPKDYSRYYKYKPWPKGVDEFYLNEPITFGPRPVPGAPEEYVDPMHMGMYDDDFEDNDDMDEGDYEDYLPRVVDESESVADEPEDAVDEERPFPGRPSSATPFHGHISEIEDDEEEDGEPRNAIMSHRDAEAAEAASKLKKQNKQEKKSKKQPPPVVNEAEAPQSSKKRNQPASEEHVPPPSSKKQKKAQSEPKESTPPAPISEEEDTALEESMPQLAPNAQKEKEVSPVPNVSVSPPAAAEPEKEEVEIVPEESMPPPSANKQEREKKRKSAAEESLPSPTHKKQKKEKRKYADEENITSPPALEEKPSQAKSMPPSPAKKQKTQPSIKGSKVTPVISKKGKPLSKAALRRLKRAGRRSSTSVATSEASVVLNGKTGVDASVATTSASESATAKPPKAVHVRKVVKETPPVMTTPPSAIVQNATTDTDGVHHPEDNPSQWMRDIVKNAKHKPPPVRKESPPPIDPNNLFGRGDPSDEESSSEEESDSDGEVDDGWRLSKKSKKRVAVVVLCIGIGLHVLRTGFD